MSVAVREPGAVIETEPIRSRRGIVWETITRRPSAVPRDRHIDFAEFYVLRTRQSSGRA